MSTDSGAIDQYGLENGLNLGYGTLDNSLESISDTGIKQAINATEGSGILATATAQSGDIISFNYTFSSNDYTPYEDFSFVSINGTTKNIASIGLDVGTRKRHP